MPWVQPPLPLGVTARFSSTEPREEPPVDPPHRSASATLGLLADLSTLAPPTPPLVILDTETTGLPTYPGARVVEIGAVAVDRTGQAVSVFTTLVRNTDRSRPALEALATSGIDPWQLAAAPTPAEAWAAFVGWAAGLPLDPEHDYEVAAYNDAFDRQMMVATFADTPTTVPVETLPWCGRCLRQTARDAHPKGRKQFHLVDLVTDRFAAVPGMTDRFETIPGRDPLRVLTDDLQQLHRGLPDALLEYRVWRTLWLLAGAPPRGPRRQ